MIVNRHELQNAFFDCGVETIAPYDKSMDENKWNAS